jgi:hypothetical protein
VPHAAANKASRATGVLRKWCLAVIQASVLAAATAPAEVK